MPVKPIEELRPALIAVGFFMMAGDLFSYALNAYTLLAGFFAAFAVYFADHALPNKSKVAWPGILISSLGFGFFAWQSDQLSWVGIGFYILLSFLYVFRWLWGNRRIQDFTYLRVCAIASGWAGLPFLVSGFPINGPSLVYVVGMSMFMVPAIVWSDETDAESDHQAGRKTLAHILSKPQRNILIFFAMALSLICFSVQGLRPMLPGPVIYLCFFRFFNRHPQHSDWVLLWPLAGSLI